MKKRVLCILILALTLPVVAQDAEIISEILKKDSVTYIDFSYLIASELGLEVSPFESWAYCDRYGNFPFNAKAGDPITVITISHFFMKNYNQPGGLMWLATHAPRYAWKELRNNGFWNRNTDPSTVLDGRGLVQAVSKFFNMWPELELQAPSTPEAAYEYRTLLLESTEEESR